MPCDMIKKILLPFLEDQDQDESGVLCGLINLFADCPAVFYVEGQKESPQLK